jgi:hypothetical protein
MPGPATNLPVANIEKTLDYFNKIYDRPVQVPQAVVDALYAFFISRTTHKNAAVAMVNTVVVTALSSKINPLTLLEEFKGLDDLRLNAHLAAFLNGTRNNTSILGVKNVPTVNTHISRTILG